MQRNHKLDCLSKKIYMLLKKLSAPFIILTLLASTCKKADTEILGTVKDFTGFDGCKIMIVLDSGQRLEIVSKPDNVTLIPDKKVAITYKEVSRVSICMAGLTVEIITLRYL